MSTAGDGDLEWLQVKLQTAIREEDYAAAASLRDQIAGLTGSTPLPMRAAPPMSPTKSSNPLARARLELPPKLPDVEAARATSVVRRAGFLSDAEMEAVHAAAAQVRAEKGSASDRKNCFERQVREGGRTVFVNERLWQLLPDIFERMVEAAREADRELWGGVLEGRRQIALRSAEYHTVLAEGGLPMPVHHDYGSLVTVDLMLSDTSEFEGGCFQTLETDGELLTHDFERGDALFFLSHKDHAVTELTAGRRNIMVVELWEGVNRRCPQRCDQPWLPCYCTYRDEFQLYARHEPEEYTPIGLSDIERLRERGRLYYRQQESEGEREGEGSALSDDEV